MSNIWKEFDVHFPPKRTVNYRRVLWRTMRWNVRIGKCLNCSNNQRNNISVLLSGITTLYWFQRNTISTHTISRCCENILKICENMKVSCLTKSLYRQPENQYDFLHSCVFNCFLYYSYYYYVVKKTQTILKFKQTPHVTSICQEVTQLNPQKDSSDCILKNMQLKIQMK